MLVHKKYIDIQAFQMKFADGFNTDDIISITEKIDGSNASYQYNIKTEEVDCFSRKNNLTPDLTLMGFYEYCRKLPQETVDFLRSNPTLRVFGEWNLKHIIKYQLEQIKTFHCFDIYDTVNQSWLPWLTVKTMCKEAKIDIVPEFYYGNFISWEHILSFVGKTEFGLDTGEGVVVKNQTRLNDPNNRLPFVTKLVAADFKERMERPAKEPISPEELEKRNKNRALAETIVTYPRVEKNLYKLITEDNLVPEGWEATDMPVIARNLPSAVYRDCVKEANDVVVEIENFGKICNQITMEYVKKMLKEKQLQF